MPISGTCFAQPHQKTHRPLHRSSRPRRLAGPSGQVTPSSRTTRRTLSRCGLPASRIQRQSRPCGSTLATCALSCPSNQRLGHSSRPTSRSRALTYPPSSACPASKGAALRPPSTPGRRPRCTSSAIQPFDCGSLQEPRRLVASTPSTCGLRRVEPPSSLDSSAPRCAEMCRPQQ